MKVEVERVRSGRSRLRRRRSAARKPYSHTVWHVKPATQEEFVARWREWAEWSQRQGLAGHCTLLRDSDDPCTFVSFARWESMEAVRSWRSLPGYQERVARLQEVVERFEPRTLEAVEEL
jgi:heme-degrading monooxygenase HmoA